MKRYRRLEDILVFHWTGDFSIIDEINNAVKSFNKEHQDTLNASKDVDNDDKILIITHNGEYGTMSESVKMNDYIIFDVNEIETSLGAYSEDYLNDHFILI